MELKMQYLAPYDYIFMWAQLILKLRGKIKEAVCKANQKFN